MLGVDLAAIMEAAVTEKLERLEAKRFGKTKKPRKSLEEVDTLARWARYLRPGEALRVGARRGSM